MISVADWLEDIRAAISFLTRVPVPYRPSAPVSFARAPRLYPLVGAAIGAVVAAVYLGLTSVAVPNLAAAALALGASVALTGGLHEDGLADMADGFGGGQDRTTKLEIMRDSRLGTYGALALLICMVAKLASIAALPAGAVLPALIAAYALARSILPVLARILPLARNDGLAATAGRPTVSTLAIAVGSAFFLALVVLPWPTALGAICISACSAIAVGALAYRQIGGQTGDVLGGAEQIAETATLVLLAASL